MADPNRQGRAMIYKFSLIVNPGDVSNNSRLIPQKLRGRYTGRLVDSADYRDGLRMMAGQVAFLRKGVLLKEEVAVSVVTYWPTAKGDVEATSKAALDALQHGGFLDNDRKVRWMRMTRGVDKQNPRIDITIATGEDMQEMANGHW